MSSPLRIAFHDGTADNHKMQSWIERLTPYLGAFEMVGLTDPLAEQAEIALVWSPPHGRLAECTQLRLIVSLGQGVDHLMSDETISSQVPIVRLVDENMSHALSQWVILNLLDHYRDGPFYRNNRTEHAFIQREQFDTAGLAVGVYGMGAIGRVIAERLSAIGFCVSGWSRTRQDFGDAITACTGEAGFKQMLANCQAHICILPLTPQTTGLFHRDVFAQMPRGAYFINGGRGRQVVEADLLEAVRSGHLSGAALDVFETEPLPSEHPFWDEDRITIWPHVAAQTNPNTAARQVAQAISDCLNGIAPKNQVQRTRGY